MFIINQILLVNVVYMLLKKYENAYLIYLQYAIR